MVLMYKTTWRQSDKWKKYVWMLNCHQQVAQHMAGAGQYWPFGQRFIYTMDSTVWTAGHELNEWNFNMNKNVKIDDLLLDIKMFKTLNVTVDLQAKFCPI